MPKTKHGLLLAPGAGADRKQSTLVEIDKALKSDSFFVKRFDFPYRKDGRKAPDREAVLLDSVDKEATTFVKAKKFRPENLLLGGRSMGGRMCSMAVARGLPAAGLILISYPLHPPGKPGKLRTDHFRDIEVPVLFVSGTKDAFGTPAELKKAIKKIHGETTLELIDGGDHGLRNKDDLIIEVVAAWLKRNKFA